MPTEHEYTLQDLADLADVTPRTVRYYIAQGLLPSPGRVGPGTTYGDGHLARLRLIRRLAREHLPLAEIRTRLAALDDDAVVALVELPAAQPAPGSAVDYIRSLLEPDVSLGLFAQPTLLRRVSPGPGPQDARLVVDADALPIAPMARAPGPAAEPAPGPERSQWDRFVLDPDVELHVRRPLTRQKNKQVERLISIARQLLEEDQP